MQSLRLTNSASYFLNCMVASNMVNRDLMKPVGSQAGLHPSSDISSCRSGNGKGPDPEDGAGGVSNSLQTRPTLGLGHLSHLDWGHQPAGALEIWLDQKPVDHCGPVDDGPQSASGQLPSPHRTTAVSSVPILRRR